MLRALHLLALLVWLPAAAAQEIEAERAFSTAANLFRDGWYERAEKEFGEVISKFPNFTNLPQAVLLQAQSRFQLKNYDGVISLVEGRLATAGPLADQYHYWRAEALFQLGRFEAAANAYAEILKAHPNSSLRLSVSYGEALARFKLGDLARTVTLLSEPAGAFQQACKSSTNQTANARGNLLLAEALFTQRDYRSATQILTNLVQRGTELDWEPQYLLTRVELAERRPDEAMRRVTNLISLANSKTNLLLKARSLALKGEILEEKQPELATQTYADIIRIKGIPPDQNRQALLKIVDLAIAQNQFTNAVGKLEELLREKSQDLPADLILLTVGELHLKQFYSSSTNVPGGQPLPRSLATNLLQQARTRFDQILRQFTNSQFIGKAHLNRGWSLWEEAQLSSNPSLFVDSEKAFLTALDCLPKSFEQASARFKLADCQFQRKDHTNALANYHLTLATYSGLPEVKDKLFDHALFQIVRLRVEIRDLGGAKAALDRLLNDFPQSSWGDRALYAYGQALVEAGDLAKAQEAFQEFGKRFAGSHLLPEVQLAIAGAYTRQTNWTAAIQQCEQWLSTYTNHHTARPRVAFERAWASFHAGRETNALVLFTNVIQQFPTSRFASLAQLWLGDYFLNKAKYDHAQAHYDLVSNSTNSAAADLSKQALLLAAKAAFLRQGWDDARGYLKRLLADPKPEPEAYFMWADIETEAPDASTNKFHRWAVAIPALERITRDFPKDRVAPLALGRIADCHFELAVQDTNRYQLAATNYYQVMVSPLADVATRCKAEVRLAKVLEKWAEHRPDSRLLFEQALDHCLNVLYPKWLQKGQDPDPFSMKEAALLAGSLAERLGRLDEAKRHYENMLRVLPSMRRDWEKRLESLRQQQTR